MTLAIRASLLLTFSVAHAGTPFGIQVVDESTSRGVPMVVIETDNHIRLVTDSAGWVAFEEPGLMGHRVHFAASSPGYAFAKDETGHAGAVLEAVAGQTAEIKAMRTSVAERLYRLTGQGIYRDSTLLGKDVPLPFANLNGDVLRLSAVQSVPYQGKLFWVWAEAGRATPHSAVFAVAATSDLPASGGLDPTQGVHFRYVLNAHDEPLPALAAPQSPVVWLDGMAVVKDTAGSEHLVAHYALMANATTRAEHGLAELDSSQIFKRKIVLGDEYAWQFPRGHVVQVKEGQGDYLYFADPFCHTRVPASYEALFLPGSYEALAWSAESQSLVWQQTLGPITQAEESDLIRNKVLKASDARTQLLSSSNGKTVTVQRGSIEWNAARQRWILIAAEERLSATPGDVWYAEAPTVTGPWKKAVQVASHGACSFTGPMQHAVLQQDGGRYIYFEGTYSSPVSGVPEPLPRYEGNQLMYRLDVNDPRLGAARE